MAALPPHRYSPPSYDAAHDPHPRPHAYSHARPHLHRHASSYFDSQSHSQTNAFVSPSSTSSTRDCVDSAMAFDASAEAPMPSMGDPSFDILDWHPAYLSCQRYFLDHAQYEPGTQAVCALINIRLPFQWLSTPITSSSTPASAPASASASAPHAGGSSAYPHFHPYQRGSVSAASRMPSPRSHAAPIAAAGESSPSSTQTFVSPVPYIRRLVVTGFDKPPILHGFFGDDYLKGIMPHVECERRNYLFAAKHGGWSNCKKHYDNGSGHAGDETVPFMKPLDDAHVQELHAADQAWKDWLAMEEWMVGPRAPREVPVARRTGRVSRGRTDHPTETLNSDRPRPR